MEIVNFVEINESKVPKDIKEAAMVEGKRRSDLGYADMEIQEYFGKEDAYCAWFSFDKTGKFTIDGYGKKQ